jgi:hypothetical protein
MGYGLDDCVVFVDFGDRICKACPMTIEFVMTAGKALDCALGVRVYFDIVDA